MGLYLSSAKRKHLNASIDHPGIIVPVALAVPCTAANRRDLNTLRNGGYNCWGCTLERTPTFVRLNIGDEVLLFENATNDVAYHGYVLHKLPDADNRLARSIWASDHDNIFLVDRIRRLQIEKSDFMNALTGNGNDTVQSPRDISPTNKPDLWNRYLAIKGQYGI